MIKKTSKNSDTTMNIPATRDFALKIGLSSDPFCWYSRQAMPA
jgi:hypothetical protein